MWLSTVPPARQKGLFLAGSNSARVVGIGASAGGIEAFQGFFRNMPAGHGLSFVVVLHLAPDRSSMLAEIVARWTSMTVLQAEDGMCIEAEHVYVTPPNAVLTVERGRLRVHVPHGDRWDILPIDIFFDALAADRGSDAIGIVLSGTGTDGAMGLKAIREAGGLTLAQGRDGSMPHHAGMPEAAMATGAVSAILPVEAMGRHIIDAGARSDAAAHPAIDARQREQVAAIRLEICAVLRAGAGHDFSQYKEQTFLRRVQRRMQALTLNAGDYLEKLKQDPGEVMLLFRDLLIGVTSFFRDPEVFDRLAELLPPLFEGKNVTDSLRVWVPGCSTGEEAYSLAILLREQMDRLPHKPKLQVFATDIDEAAIGIARAGRYPALLLKDVSPERRARFFVETGGSFAVTRELRELCTFSVHSVVRDPPFSRMDLLSCRNLLIYLDTQLQSHVIPAFHYSLVAGGIMLLGRSETITRHAHLFSVLDNKNRIYMRADTPTPPLQLSLASMAGRPPAANTTGAGDMRATPNHAVQAANARIQSQFAPAFLLVDGQGDTVHYAPRAGRYLEFSPGIPTRNIVTLARQGLKTELRDALRRARETGRSVTGDGVRIETEAGVQFLTLTVEPLGPEAGTDLYLVVFADHGPVLPREQRSEDAAPARDARRSEGAAPDRLAQDGLVEQHERELREVRDQLQSTTEEYETAVEELKSANEELHSINEELQSTNEELETSKEEIQSMNEELHTVNAQLIAKVEELDKVNSDLNNLFESTKMATVFLDQHLIIRNFTPAIAGIYNLIPSDRGRPFTDITGSIDYPELRADLRQVLADLEPLERRVARLDREVHYLMRMLPYRAADNAVEGALITFIDVTSVVQAEQHHRLLVDELNHRVKNMLTVVISMVRQTQRGAEEVDDFCETFLGRLQALASAYALLSHEDWTEVGLADILLEELSPYRASAGDNNIVLEGPGVSLRPGSALAFGMIVHELATNAAKYGALSVPDGQISVRWHFEGDGDPEMLVWHWAEQGGPAVSPPTRQGFGVKLIERSIRHELRGDAEVRFLETGLEAILTMPLHPESIRRKTSRKKETARSAGG